MKKSKTQKGITLIALIITIVVLLILAAVTIASITETNLINQATTAGQAWNNAQTNENTTLGEYESQIGSYIPVTPVEPKVGQYVEYDVSYTDMYQGTEYTSTNGWRYLGTDDYGNKLLISTAIPMKLYYHNSTAGENAKWWDEDTTLKANVRAINGMIKNFAKIPYTQKTSDVGGGTANTAIGRFAGTEITVDGTTYTAIGDTFKSSTYSSKIQNVRTLTLPELNTAVNSANGNTDRAETSTIPEGVRDLTGDAIGLFDMCDLPGYTANYYYWLATPGSTDAKYNDIYMYSVGSFYNMNNVFYGVRPVVVLSSGVQFTDADSDGVLEIH